MSVAGEPEAASRLARASGHAPEALCAGVRRGAEDLGASGVCAGVPAHEDRVEPVIGVEQAAAEAGFEHVGAQGSLAHEGVTDPGPCAMAGARQPQTAFTGRDGGGLALPLVAFEEAQGVREAPPRCMDDEVDGATASGAAQVIEELLAVDADDRALALEARPVGGVWSVAEGDGDPVEGDVAPALQRVAAAHCQVPVKVCLEGRRAGGVTRYRYPHTLGVRRGNGLRSRLAGGPAIDGGGRRGRLFGPGRGDAVSALGNTLDASLADEPVQRLGDGGGPGGGALADLTLGQGCCGFGEGLDDALLGRLGRRRGLGRQRAAQAQGGSLGVIGELDLDIVEPGGGAMLGGHHDLPVAPAQVQIRIAPGMQLATSAQGLSRPGRTAFASVVDEHHGGCEASLELAQEAEDGGDLGDGVLVDAMQAHQGVEDQQPRSDPLHGLEQPLAVEAMVEAQCGHVDDGDVEGVERGAGGAGDAGQPGAHDMAGVLGGEHQDRSGLRGGEAAQARDAGGDGDGELQRQEGLAALGLAADDADRLACPEPVDEPLLLVRPVLELGRGSGREALHRRALRGCTSSPQVSRKSFSSSCSRSCSAPAASRASAMMASALGLPSA